MPAVLRLDGPGVGVLLATECTRCGAMVLGLRKRCLNCTSSAVKARECSPQGTLVNYTIVHRAAESWSGRTPYALGQVSLSNGLTVTAEIVDAPFDRLTIGMQMRLSLGVAGQDAAGHALLINKWTPTS